MFPKTTYPDEMRALLLTASEGNALPLWQAVPLTAALAALPAGTLRDYFPLPQPPEEQLRRTASPEETGAVYRLCALLVRLLSGKEMPERTGPSDRRAVLRTLAAEACPAGEEALFRLLDRGLRLIREAGVDAQSGREETEECILLTIRIPKQRSGPQEK